MMYGIGNGYTGAGDFQLIKRYCPGLGRNVPIMVQSVSPFGETCLCGGECLGKYPCERYGLKKDKSGTPEVTGDSLSRDTGTAEQQ